MSASQASVGSSGRGRSGHARTGRAVVAVQGKPAREPRLTDPLHLSPTLVVRLRVPAQARFAWTVSRLPVRRGPTAIRRGWSPPRARACATRDISAPPCPRNPGSMPVALQQPTVPKALRSRSRYDAGTSQQARARLSQPPGTLTLFPSTRRSAARRCHRATIPQGVPRTPGTRRKPASPAPTAREACVARALPESTARRPV